jgi:hypothetical protein
MAEIRRRRFRAMGTDHDSKPLPSFPRFCLPARLLVDVLSGAFALSRFHRIKLYFTGLFNHLRFLSLKTR